MSSVNEPKVKLGYEEYCLFADDGNRHEIIGGRHYMSPAPSPNHQSVSKYLQHFLFTRIELRGLGKVFNAPIDLQLGDFDIVQPDLVVLLNDSRARVTLVKIEGPPDLLVEILSPSTSKNDLTLKRILYQQSGVREYWIVDPKACRVTQLVLQDGEYRELPVSEEEISLSVLSTIKIPLSEIWNR